MFRVPSLRRIAVGLGAAGALLMVCALTSCGGGTQPEELTPVTFQLSWTHWGGQTGYFAADQLGFYAEEGLAVTFIEGGPGIDSVSAVEDGLADFGEAEAASLILARADGSRARAIGVVDRRSPAVFITRGDSGITQPSDFAGKTIRVNFGGATTLHAVAARVGLSSHEYEEVTIPSDVDQFLSGKPEVWGAYLTGLVLGLEQAGHQPNVIYPDDYGVHFYGRTIFTTDQLITADPDLVLRFLRATIRGFAHAVANPQTAAALIVEYDPDADVELNTSKWLASLPLVNTGQDSIGWIRPASWSGMAATMREYGELTAALNIEDVYTTRFIEAIY